MMQIVIIFFFLNKYDVPQDQNEDLYSDNDSFYEYPFIREILHTIDFGYYVLFPFYYHLNEWFDNSSNIKFHIHDIVMLHVEVEEWNEKIIGILHQDNFDKDIFQIKRNDQYPPFRCDFPVAFLHSPYLKYFLLKDT